MSRSADETFAVADYMRSRDAVDYLIAHHDLKNILSRPEADAFSRFPNFFARDTRESLYRHFRQMVDAEVEPGTGVSVLRVSAFRPQDAKATADALLASAEDLINRLNARANNDAVDYANKLVGEATKSLNVVEQGITKYRHEQKLVDVDREAVAALEMIGRLSVELAQQEATLSQQLQMTPNSPAISSLREKINAYRNKIEELRGKLVGTHGSLATRMAPYELLLLERELAAKALGLATLNLEKARQNAQLQHLYLQVIVQANLPDQALYPKRWWWFSIVCALSLLAFWICSSIYRIAMEHQA